jgi:hypothetical protein
MNMLRWFVLLWLILCIVSGIFLEKRREAFRVQENTMLSHPTTGKCEWIALRPMPAAYRVAAQDVVGPSGPAVKLDGKYTWRALAKGEPVCEQDLSAAPHIVIPQGSSGVVISLSPGSWNAGAIVDLWSSGVVVLENARMAGILCEQSCNQAMIEVPSDKVAVVLASQLKGALVVVIRSSP